jgi:transcriptional regulator with XRE-family HTH domain
MAVDATRHLGLNIHQLRIDAQLTQYQLSEQASMDRSFLQRIEAGKSSPTAEILMRLKRALNCTWNQLFHGVEEEPLNSFYWKRKPELAASFDYSQAMNQPALSKILIDLSALIKESEKMEDIDSLQAGATEKMIQGCLDVGKLQAAWEILNSLVHH